MEKKKKIAIVSGSLHSIPPTANSPAVPRNIFRYAENLQDFFEVVVISFDKGPIETLFNQGTKAKYIRISPRGKYSILKKIIGFIPHSFRKKVLGKANENFIAYYLLAQRHLKKEKPDYVLTTMHIDAVPFMYRASPTSKHFFFFRSSNPETETKAKLVKIASYLHGFISLTKEAEDYIKNNISPYVPLKTYVVPNFIDENKFNILQKASNREKARNRFGLDNDDFVVGYAGRITNGKGIEFLMSVMNEVHKKQDKVKLLIAGDERIETNPDTRLKLSDFSGVEYSTIVRCTGWLPYNEMPMFYAALDVGMLLSKGREGHSMFALESMACGVPVIATKVGGNSEIIENKITGYLIEEDENSRYLCQVIMNLISSPSLLKTLSKNAAAHAINRYNFDSSYNKIIEIFNNETSN